MSSILLFFGIISLLVIIHELGHYFAAKKMGVKVEEFGLGLPPKLFGKQFGETFFSFNALPFGGFVRLKGEEEHNNETDSFESKKPSQRAFIIIAGVLMNLILGILIFQGTLLARDFKSEYFPIISNIKPSFGKLELVSGLIAGLSDESKLDKNALKNGDYVFSINQIEVSSNDQLKQLVNNSTSDNVVIVIKNIKDGTLVKEVNVPLINKDGKKYLGIYLGEAGRVVYEGNDRFISGILHSANVLKLSFQSLGLLIDQTIQTKDMSILAENVDGPVGIYSVVDSINQNNTSIINLDILDLIAILSLSLAVMNILPIPAVDGGRLVFIVYEMISRKKPNPKFELAVNKYGMLFLLGMLILVTFKDVTNIFSR